VYPEGSAKLYAHYLFNAIDVDAKGFITFDDFMQTISILTEGPVHQKAACKSSSKSILEYFIYTASC